MCFQSSGRKTEAEVWGYVTEHLSIKIQTAERCIYMVHIYTIHRGIYRAIQLASASLHTNHQHQVPALNTISPCCSQPHKIRSHEWPGQLWWWFKALCMIYRKATEEKACFSFSYSWDLLSQGMSMCLTSTSGRCQGKHVLFTSISVAV